jgi:hypothetical protein
LTQPRSLPTSASRPGSTIVAIEQEQMTGAAEVQKKVDALKKAGKKTALLLVATAEGDYAVRGAADRVIAPRLRCKGRPQGRPLSFPRSNFQVNPARD